MLQVQYRARSVCRALPPSSGIEGSRLQFYVADPAGRPNIFPGVDMSWLVMGPMLKDTPDLHRIRVSSTCRRDQLEPDPEFKSPPCQMCFKVAQSQASAGAPRDAAPEPRCFRPLLASGVFLGLFGVPLRFQASGQAASHSRLFCESRHVSAVFQVKCAACVTYWGYTVQHVHTLLYPAMHAYYACINAYVKSV